MYSPEEIKVALRKYIDSTGDTSIDEQSIISILDQGADRDFNMVAPTIKSIRANYGVKKSIPMWLRMLTFRLIYDCMASDKQIPSLDKKQETLLSALGFNKKVFDSTSWKMYSPEMKLRQSRFNPVDFPFSYAEVESNPIYVAMLHHLISEARVLTNSFVDVFGKMGYVPAFCAEGYAHKLIFTNESDSYLKYYHGITDRPTRTYKVLQGYFDKINEVLSDNYLTREERHEKIQEKLFDTNTVLLLTNLLETNTDMEYSKYAAAKFCQICLNNPYWEDRNVGEHSVVVNEKKRLNGGKLINSKKQIEVVDADRFIEEDYSSIIRAKKFISISKDDFITYTHALKKVEYVNKTDSLLSFIFKNFNQYAISIDSYIDYDYSGNLCQELKRVAYQETPLLYVDAPKYGEYNRFSFNPVKYMRLLESLLLYNGDWILTFKNYNHERVDYSSEEFSVKHFRERMKASERPLFEYKYSTKDRNVRNSISFFTTIDFDELTAQEFKRKYNIKLKTNDAFQKLKVN